MVVVHYLKALEDGSLPNEGFTTDQLDADKMRQWVLEGGVVQIAQMPTEAYFAIPATQAAHSFFVP